ncbi:MAG: flotillin family protein [Gammaproteobacteria bacterium]
MNDVILWIIIAFVLLAIVVALFAWFYQRATREVALVKTGIGGRKVVMDGGLVAIPYFHEVARVNMQTLRLEVKRAAEEALITKDRLRVDVGAEFYVSVVASEEGIARAAQTLGNRTFHADQLRELIEGKLVDALRSVAARMTMDELHENRARFVDEVRDSLMESLARNGLELDTVSLTSLDQTPFDKLDENNAFNAVGMRKLAEVIARSKKERAEIDADAEVSVRKAAMEATKRKLQIDLEIQEAEIRQVQEIEALRAAQLAEVARRKAEGEREAAEARIAMEREISTAEIARKRDVELAQQESDIALAAKSQEESRARAAADAVRREAVEAAEAVKTAREVAEAERRKAIALVEAAREAETEGVRIRLLAQSEKEAAADRAQAQREAAETRRQEMLAEAEGTRALAEAENAYQEHVVALKTEKARLKTLPKVVAELVRPAEKIESIRIHNLNGLGSGASLSAPAHRNNSAINQVVDSILDLAVRLPAAKKLGEEVGIELGRGVEGIVDSLSSQASTARNGDGEKEG